MGGAIARYGSTGAPLRAPRHIFVLTATCPLVEQILGEPRPISYDLERAGQGHRKIRLLTHTALGRTDRSLTKADTRGACRNRTPC